MAYLLDDSLILIVGWSWISVNLSVCSLRSTKSYNYSRLFSRVHVIGWIVSTSSWGLELILLFGFNSHVEFRILTQFLPCVVSTWSWVKVGVLKTLSLSCSDTNCWLFLLNSVNIGVILSWTWFSVSLLVSSISLSLSDRELRSLLLSLFLRWIVS